MFKQVLKQQPDCLVFDSHAREGGENYIFLEKGFKKLAIREVRLDLGSRGKSHNRIRCAVGSGYSPRLEGYGEYFKLIAKTAMNERYLQNQEYITRKANLEELHKR